MADPAASLLDFAFRDPALREAALTHRSAGNPHNERLEFLGDSLLNFVIAEALYLRLPAADEGALTRLRAHLVRGETLAELAGAMRLGEAIQLGPGELRSGGHRRASILADALEALLGAILCDAGYAEAAEQTRRLFAARLDDLPSPEALKDPKTRLQEWLQARDRPRPEYEVVAQSGPDHRRRFHVRCSVPGEAATEAEGPSRRQAEQLAARAMFDRLGAA